MIKRLGKLLLALGVLCLLLAGTLYLFRTSLVAYGLTRLLEREGARQVTVDVTQVAGDRIEISDLDLALPRGTRLLDLELDNLTVGFVAAELRHARLRDITLERLALRQTPVPEQRAQKAPTPIDLPELLHRLRGNWQDRLPFRSAKIATLQLAGPDLPPALTHPLTLAVTRTDSGIKVDCRPASPGSPTDVGLVLEQQAGTLFLKAVAAEAGDLSATLAGEQLKGSFALDPARLNSLLVLFGRNAVPAFDQFGSARLSGTFRADLERWPWFNLEAQLAAESLTLGKTTLKGLDLDLSLEAMDFENPRRPLQAGRLRVVVAQLAQADVSLAGIEGQFEVTAGENGNYRLSEASAFTLASFKAAGTSFHDATFPLSGTLGLTQKGQIRLHLNGAEYWRLTELKTADLSIAKAMLRPAFTVQLARKSARIDCRPAFRLNLERLAGQDLRIPELALQPSTAEQLQIDMADGPQWTLQDSRWRIKLPLVEHARGQLRPGELAINLEASIGQDRSVSLTGSAQSERITIATAGRQAYGRKVLLNFSLTPKEAKGEGDFFIGPYPQPLSFWVQHKLASGRGTFRLTTPSPLKLSEKRPLSRIVDPWDFPGDASAGRIDLTLTANWAPEKAATAVADIELEEIGGRWRDVAFSGLSLTHRVQLWPMIDSLDRALLAIDLITFGVPITETRATLQLRQRGQTLDAPLSVELEEGHFTLLGSLFSLTPFIYQSDAAENRIRISTAKLDLAQLTPLFKTQGLQLTGLAAATLPLEIGAGGVEMVTGTIRQKSPGVVTYRPPDRDMLKRAGLPDVVIKALANFHYDHLEVDAAYRPDGQLDLAVRLRGKSPTAGTDRPIHLNLNIEQNLLSLLKSLRYSGTFDRKIEKHMKQKR